ncbi:MAG: hypothetical protein OXT74_17395, partial [Candidatus Poribacteria bacterium]|nr:hypothetical protein [Candidatus Poribacteria bacterium]
DVTPDQAAPNYFPMTVGNRWVYRNPDGSEWVREVKESKEIGLHLYHVFNYHPPLEDPQFEFLKTPNYAAAPSRLLLLIENEIDDAIRQSIEQVDGFYLDFYKTKIVSDGELTVLRLPLSAGLRWDALNISLRGGEGIGEFSHSFEADWVVTGTAGFRESVDTPAGSFENCLKIQYEMRESVEFEWGPDERGQALWEDIWRDREKPLREELSTVLAHILPNLNLETVWLAPGVGPVKIEGTERTAELIEYHLAEER